MQTVVDLEQPALEVKFRTRRSLTSHKCSRQRNQQGRCAPVASHEEGPTQRMLVTAPSYPASDLLCGKQASLSKASSLGHLDSRSGITVATTLSCSFLTWHGNPGRPRNSRGQGLQLQHPIPQTRPFAEKCRSECC